MFMSRSCHAVCSCMFMSHSMFMYVHFTQYVHVCSCHTVCSCHVHVTQYVHVTFMSCSRFMYVHVTQYVYVWSCHVHVTLMSHSMFMSRSCNVHVKQYVHVTVCSCTYAHVMFMYICSCNVHVTVCSCMFMSRSSHVYVTFMSRSMFMPRSVYVRSYLCMINMACCTVIISETRTAESLRVQYLNYRRESVFRRDKLSESAVYTASNFGYTQIFLVRFPRLHHLN